MEVFNTDGVQVGRDRMSRNDRDFLPAEQFHDIDPYDTDNPKSMINMVPDWIKSRMLNETMRKLAYLSDEELEAEVKPNLSLKRLRTAFWAQYDNLHNSPMRNNKNFNKIGIFKMCMGICTTQYFMEKIARNDFMLAYIIRPPLDYDNAMQESLQHGLNRVREILNFPLYEPRFNKDGLPIVDKHTGEQVMSPNEKIANLILKTVAFLDLRIKGATVQKIHQVSDQNITRRSLNMNVKSGNRVVTVDPNALDDKLLTIEDLDAKIRSLSNETNALVNDPRYTVAENRVIEQDASLQMDAHAKETGHEKLTELDVEIPKNELNPV